MEQGEDDVGVGLVQPVERSRPVGGGEERASGHHVAPVRILGTEAPDPFDGTVPRGVVDAGGRPPGQRREGSVEGVRLVGEGRCVLHRAVDRGYAIRPATSVTSRVRSVSGNWAPAPKLVKTAIPRPTRTKVKSP